MCRSHGCAGAYLGSWSMKPRDDINKDKGKGNKLTEQSRTEDTLRVFDPDDETSFIDVKRTTELVMVDPFGRIFTMRLKPGS